jgi:outer membrane protein
VLKVAEETVQARQLFADQVSALAKSELKSELDVSFANVALQEAKLLKLEAENRVATSFANLSNALGYRTPRRFALSEEPQFSGPNANLAALINQALELRPEVLSLRHERSAATRIVGADHAAHFPKVSIIGAAGRTPVGDATAEGNYGSVGVIVDVPIFTGFRLTARDEESRLREKAAAESVREMEDLVAKDVEIALLNTNTAFDKIGVTAALLGSARQANNLAEAKYRLGTTSIVEFVQAQLALLQAQIDHATATYEYQIQRLTLDFQIAAPRFLIGPPGGLTPEEPPNAKKRPNRGR